MDESTDSSYSDGNAAIEVIEIDICGILPKLIEMTSLAALVYSDREWSREPSKTLSDFECDDEDGTRLTLAYEKLHTIPRTLIDRFGASLKILDISHNKISNLDFLIHFKNLTSLIADNNLITENTYLPQLPKLQLLWLNHCKIERLFPWVKKLQHSCPGLNHICLMGNTAAPSYLNGGTFYDYLQYRLYVISLFPELKHLDDRSVTEDQRSESKRLYKRPFFERLTSFNYRQYPISASMQSNAMQRWRALRLKMFGFFETNTNGSAGNHSRNLFV